MNDDPFNTAEDGDAESIPDSDCEGCCEGCRCGGDEVWKEEADEYEGESWDGQEGDDDDIDDAIL